MLVSPRQAAAFARLLIVWFAAFLVLRIMLEAQAPKLGPVRGSSIYLLVLFGLVLLSTRILFLCLSSPNVLIAVPPKYQSSPLSDPDLDALELRIRDLLETKKVYRKPDLKLAEVARLVGAVDREISQVVNSRFGTNFAALVNRLRVEEAAERLASSGSTAITTILFDVGFGSKSAFQREFARRFEISPSEYRRRARREPGRTPNTLAG